MKKILLSALVCVALVGCGSKDENKTASNAQPVQGKLRQDPATCPNLSGNYGEGNDSIYIDTKVEGGVHEYALEQGGNYIPADGQTRGSAEGSVRVTCGQNAVEIFVKRTGQADIDIVLTDIGNDQIRAEVGGQTAVLTRQGAHAPNPAPIPGPAPTPVPGSVCPVLTGTYASDTGNESIVLDTQVQGNVYSYKFSADQRAYLPADGITHQLPNNQGSYRVSCAADGGKPSVSMNVNLAGRDPVSIQMTDLGAGALRAVANGQTQLMHKR